ncbi:MULTISPECIES: hypothetical protein [Prochlorococcus]|uniref:hypothetical protein n=1 Tax=Prochlorococcus TaxID=1218 RepID=UPI001F310FCD|nr:hypothetical protein [Prochlorococcus marinus]
MTSCGRQAIYAPHDDNRFYGQAIAGARPMRQALTLQLDHPNRSFGSLGSLPVGKKPLSEALDPFFAVIFDTFRIFMH